MHPTDSLEDGHSRAQEGSLRTTLLDQSHDGDLESPPSLNRWSSLRSRTGALGESEIARWWTVVIFALAMAWVESAVVYYLRTMINRIEPYQRNPLPVMGGLGSAEMVREAATLVMLIAVGILAGRNWRSRFGYAAVAFGIWDIFYYVFLKILCGWPHSLWDWDILFLLPLPWWEPVMAPVSIALLMLVWGTLATQTQIVSPTDFVGWKSWALNIAGIALALYTFMADALRVSNQGVDALRNLLPARFNWSLFNLALLLMAVPIIKLCCRLGQQKHPRNVSIKIS